MPACADPKAYKRGSHFSKKEQRASQRRPHQGATLSTRHQPPQLWAVSERRAAARLPLRVRAPAGPRVWGRPRRARQGGKRSVRLESQGGLTAVN